MMITKPHAFILLTVISLFISYSAYPVSRKPVIGIVSTPSDFHNVYDPEEYSYIKGSYAEFIDAAGAIPIAIPWDLPERELITLLNSINGVLFTGGDASLWEYDPVTEDLVFSNFTQRAVSIVKYALSLNDKGIHFPVYGICQGFEVITLSIAGNVKPIDHFVHPGQLDYVEITEEGQDSRMFAGMPDHLVDFLKDQKNMFYNHRYGFNMSLLENFKVLNDFFRITAKGSDDNGKEFVAGMEAKEYPIYIVQYHPERVLSEWKNKTVFDHPEDAAQAMIIHSVYLVSEAMKNNQKFEAVEVLERFKLDNHEHVYMNKTWPRTHFYDKKSLIKYHVNPDWKEYSQDNYDCATHDCSFITSEL
jgi:gamma-glutamyl hydrolase